MHSEATSGWRSRERWWGPPQPAAVLPSVPSGLAGRAAGVIRSLHRLGRLERALCTETRPYNQGARLTAFELVYEQIPATLIADSAAAAAMAQRSVSGQRGRPRGHVLAGAGRQAQAGS